MFPDRLTLRENAERAAHFLIEHAKRRAGVRFHQGNRRPALSHTGGGAVGFIAEQRVWRLHEHAARGLVRWSNGFPVELLTEIPSADHVFELQSRGARCVSLLPDGVPTGAHADAFEFVTHDLCHLDKFADPRHYSEQVGFFGEVGTVMAHPAWKRTEQELDPVWREDRDHLLSDTNGSSVYLFAILKMKLKMAARRQLARRRGTPASEAGQLDAGETEVFETLFARLLDLFWFDPSLRSAAWTTSARRDCPQAAARLAAYFSTRGVERLSGRMGVNAQCRARACGGG
jgi:hypothetical protein